MCHANYFSAEQVYVFPLLARKQTTTAEHNSAQPN